MDLFAGIGGMTCGFIQTGDYVPVFAVEIDSAAAAIYRANFGDHVHEGDIAEVDRFPEVDVVIGGPPCQGFSPLGTKRADDPRNKLWEHFVRALSESGAPVFAMENVPELFKSQEYARFKRAARRLGYALAEDVLNAADYGVPQLRRRAIVIGSKLGNAPWPTPTHQVGGYVTVREALRGLPLEPDGRRWHRARLKLRPSSFERYRAVPEGGNRFDLARNRPDLLPRCWREKPTGTTDVFGRLWWDRPAFTIRTEFYKPEKGRYLHPSEHRPITVREAARCMSFPDDFEFPKSQSMTSVAKQIGNAVPPDLARSIACALATHLKAASTPVDSRVGLLRAA
jgi:DNA (cytosine-5)-methyltransferase 1